MKELQDLSVIIAKYYLPEELFVGQVEEVIAMLTECLAVRFSHIQAVNKANHIVAKYYLNIAEAEAHPGRQLSEEPSCFGSLRGTCSNCTFYLRCLLRTNDRDLRRGF